MTGRALFARPWATTKVDNAEFQGTILELRKELARVKVKYQRAAARCTKLEAMYYTLKDARDADPLPVARAST
jgi:hypothetical protein